MDGINVPRYEEQRPLPMVRISTIGMAAMVAVWISWTVLQLYIARTLSPLNFIAGGVIFVAMPLLVYLEGVFHRRAFRHYHGRWEGVVGKVSVADLKTAILDPKTDEATAIQLLLHLRQRLALDDAKPASQELKI